MRKRKKNQQDFSAPWLITFTDLMTLVLTFFVTLVAMSVFDERSKLMILDSVNSVFGRVENRLNPHPTDRMDPNHVPGFQRGHDDSLTNIRKLIMSDNPDIRLSQNNLFTVLSINGDVIFAPGSVSISPEGRAILDRLVPYLLRMKHPMRIAGHSSPGLEEGGLSYGGTALHSGNEVDSTWGISMDRTLAVYLHLASRGVATQLMRMESYGEYQPAFSNDSADGRRKNRRVDLILDKRNNLFGVARETSRFNEEHNKTYQFRDFDFNLEYDQPSPVRLPEAGGVGPGGILPDEALPGRFGRHGGVPDTQDMQAPRSIFRNPQSIEPGAGSDKDMLEAINAVPHESPITPAEKQKDELREEARALEPEVPR
ncbi:OmpA family protein [Desulfovibrio sp. OttesenSCG-928-C06]|nr:OmpA family protein [Desulfovibrio sp. OttesenSCG-928-C06]